MLVQIGDSIGLHIPSQLVTTEVIQALMESTPIRSTWVGGDIGYVWYLDDAKLLIDPITKAQEKPNVRQEG